MIGFHEAKALGLIDHGNQLLNYEIIGNQTPLSWDNNDLGGNRSPEVRSVKQRGDYYLTQGAVFVYLSKGKLLYWTRWSIRSTMLFPLST